MTSDKTYSWDTGNETWTQQAKRRFIYDGIYECDGSNNIIASYVRDGNIGGVISRATPNGKYFYHYDGNGNDELAPTPLWRNIPIMHIATSHQ